MSKKKSAKNVPSRRNKGLLFPICGLAALLIVAAGLFVYLYYWRTPSNVKAYKEKLALLETAALTEETQATLGENPAGERAKYAVFFSVCDTTERASVFCGTGADLRSAWDAVDAKVTDFLSDSDYDPVWLKADLVYTSETLQEEELARAVADTWRDEYYRWGVALDPYFNTALLEAELNSAKIFDYDNGGIDWEYLDRYLTEAGRTASEWMPNSYLVFQCLGWFCDEDSTVYELGSEGLDYGRRAVTVNKEYARELIMNASAFLEAQVKGNGSFVYGIYPRFDREIENYSIIRHGATLWSLILYYQLAPSEALAEKIDRIIGFMLDSVLYDPEGRAYLYSESVDEIHLGGGSIVILALTEYMNTFGNEKYVDLCRAMGEGILNLLDQSSGEYYHVLDKNFNRKQQFRVIFYDGEATFALCRLYGLTGDSMWLDAARSTVDHFIAADYTQYRDNWVSYAVNEITKYVTDNKEYYDFALANAQDNLKEMYDRATVYPTYLEMLMPIFEVYDRMQENGIDAGDFDLQTFLGAISVRVERQVNGYFYPEYAMYMKNPQRILNAFMIRQDGFRVRIDDVQHNIGGLYLYYKNYDKLVGYGLLDG